MLRYAKSVTQELPETPRDSELAAGWKVQPESGAPEPVEELQPTPETARSEQLSSVSVMLLGVFGGLFMLYTWSWFVVAQAFAELVEPESLMGGIPQQIMHWVGVAAPATWFVVAYLVTKKRGSLMLALALILGAVVLFPLPLNFGGGF